MRSLDDYLLANEDREFAYGKWDCALFVLGWVALSAPKTAAAARSWLDEQGYFSSVNGERTFRRFLARAGVRNAADCALAEIDGLRSDPRARAGGVCFMPSGVFGLVGADLRAVLLLRGSGYVREDLAAGTRFIGWEGMKDGR